MCLCNFRTNIERCVILCNSWAKKKSQIANKKNLDAELKFEQGARFGRLLDALDMTQTTLSQQTGIAQSTISAIITGRRDLNKNAINALKKNLPEVNTNWLLTGEGEMFLSFSSKKNTELVEDGRVSYVVDPLSALRLLLENHERRLLELERIVEEMQGVPAGVGESPTLKE